MSIEVSDEDETSACEARGPSRVPPGEQREPDYVGRHLEHSDGELAR
jgi:hypothetical protein